MEEKEDDGIGLPHIIVDCSDKSTPVYEKVYGCGKFPSMEEVWFYLYGKLEITVQLWYNVIKDQLYFV